MNNHGYGYEFSINNKIFYPAYLDRKCLNRLASAFLIRFNLHSEFEIKVRRSAGNKGIDWIITTFMPDDPSVESRCYTFCIINWAVANYQDHWKSGSITPRCQANLEFEEELNQIVKTHKEGLLTYYKDAKTPSSDQYLIDDQYHVILSDNDSRERSFVILDFEPGRLRKVV